MRPRDEGRQPRLIAGTALVALLVAQGALRVLSFQTVRRLFLGMATFGRAEGVRRPKIETLVWAMEAAKRRCPVRTTCLGEALAAEALFTYAGYAPVFCIGAARAGGRFEAHAWLEHDDVIVVGGPASVVERYTKFPRISATSK